MTVFVNGIMYFKVKNAIHAVANVDDYSGSARLLAATTLRNVLGTMTLGEILSHRENIAKEMKDAGKKPKMYIHTWELFDKAFSFPRVRRYAFVQENMDMLEHF